jgi:hypothetical protein
MTFYAYKSLKEYKLAFEDIFCFQLEINNLDILGDCKVS